MVTDSPRIGRLCEIEMWIARGTLDVESVLSGGSVFRLELPVS